MKRAEIEEQIMDIVDDGSLNDTPIVDRLTNLFIQLSEERCQEQREICSNEYRFLSDESQFKNGIEKLILNAPFPTLD